MVSVRRLCLGSTAVGSAKEISLTHQMAASLLPTVEIAGKSSLTSPTREFLALVVARRADDFVYRFFDRGPFWTTAAFTSALNAPGSTFSPSWMSIALRVLPSRLELKRLDGSGILAPRANVSFTTFVYASPVQTIPAWDHTGTPNGFVGLIHLHSSTMSGSASRISARMRAKVSPRHPPRSRIRWSMSREAAALAAGLAFAPAFGFLIEAFVCCWI